MTYIPTVHKSTITTAQACMKLLEYKEILKIKPPTKSEASLLGTALHDTIAEMHLEVQRNRAPWKVDLNTVTKWYHTFQSLTQEAINNCHRNNIEVILRKEDKDLDFLEMIAGYMDKPYNRYAEPILIEVPWRVTIRNKYHFEGTIDQIVRVPISYLDPEMLLIDQDSPYCLNKNDYPYVYFQRDIKTGEKHVSYTDIEFSNDLNVYAYACAYGEFLINGAWRQIKLIPYAHCLYFLQDHIKYKRKYGSKQAGDEHGDGMYFCYRRLDRLPQLEEELIKLWKYVNSGNWVRTGNSTGTCDRLCEYKNICIKQFHGEL